ncbi:AbrB/MazE/SpoVT family DNA-binding domain-containing protein [Deinococcus peraridilitoris]|uniref:Looped-hinge helix DNA binding domain, AbrB family n=1 Tax=Deinococcus peraridilitoris (strain DSM 19664 / LMG 22246 / CIP 109416 / KR-200) TaxID=937777 RepID=L0A8V2_DEIPD|nr:AbrB/MazE/SpoVT family DNA-binding domain-containing protein [Deinococcus peraridilitoris]AFZ69495.1 looped-hinge helix DNA binding domain, AbrB family [Deinococcus peraridilitoris DSM 19664]
MVRSQFAVSVREHGRLNLPKELREALGVKEGENLIFRVKEDGSAEVVTPQTLARRGRGLFTYLKQVESETDDFIAQRRKEAEQ